MTVAKGNLTLQAINSQAHTWSEVLQYLLKDKIPELLPWLKTEAFAQIVFIGCGSSYYLGSLAAGLLHRQTGLTAYALAASEILFFPHPPYDPRKKTLIIAISRSGATTETILAAEKLLQLHPGAQLLCLSTNGETKLAAQAQQSIILHSAAEDGVVMLKSFTAFLLALYILMCVLTHDQPLLTELTRLPEKFKLKAFEYTLHRLEHLAFAEILVLGSGSNYPLAQEAALKFIEMAGIQAFAYQSLEYRHGPISIVRPQNLFVVLISDALRPYEEELLYDLAGLKAHTIVICESLTPRIKTAASHIIELNSGLSEIPRAFVTLPLLQLYSHFLACAKGLDPDKPKRVAPVVKLTPVKPS